MSKDTRMVRGEITLNDIIQSMHESIEMEGNVPEEILIDKLKEIYNFLYVDNGNDYYLINYDKWFDLLNRYRDKMGEEYQLKIKIE